MKKYLVFTILCLAILQVQGQNYNLHQAEKAKKETKAKKRSKNTENSGNWFRPKVIVPGIKTLGIYGGLSTYQFELADQDSDADIRHEDFLQNPTLGLNLRVFKTSKVFVQFDLGYRKADYDIRGYHLYNSFGSGKISMTANKMDLLTSLGLRLGRNGGINFFDISLGLGLSAFLHEFGDLESLDLDHKSSSGYIRGTSYKDIVNSRVLSPVFAIGLNKDFRISKTWAFTIGYRFLSSPFKELEIETEVVSKWEDEFYSYSDYSKGTSQSLTVGFKFDLDKLQLNNLIY